MDQAYVGQTRFMGPTNPLPLLRVYITSMSSVQLQISNIAHFVFRRYGSNTVSSRSILVRYLCPHKLRQKQSPLK